MHTIKEFITPITYRIIKCYRDRYIMPPVNRESYFTNIVSDPDESAKIIKGKLLSDNPCMISRFGIVELDAALNYRKDSPLSFLRNLIPFWVGEETKNKMQTNAGFFPISNRMLSDFSDLIMNIAPEIDLLTTFRPEEELMPGVNCKKIKAPYLEPFWSSDPWTSVLKGEKIVVIHPFAETISTQYEKRDLLFDNK